MSQKYNAALSTRDKTRFTSTIHAINSAIVKLSVHQRAVTVYRVMSIPAPPEKFFEVDARGSSVGFEPQFMSTTTNLTFAMRLLSERQWARQAGHSSGGAQEAIVLIRVRVIPTDQAADVSFASQSPSEQEVIFTSLSTFDVVSRYREPALSATIADLRPRRGTVARTIDQVIGTMKGSHIEFLDLMIDELRAAGAPEPSLLPLSTLRTERQKQEANDFNATEKYVDFTASALRAQLNVLRDLSKEAAWHGEKTKGKELAMRMLAIVAIQVRIGEHDAAIEMTRLAVKRSSLPMALSAQLDEIERHVVAVTSNQSAAVVKPSEIKKMFPESQHSVLEAAIFFLNLGMVPPWPPLLAALLAKMSPASHMAFGELVTAHQAEQTAFDRGSNVMIFDENIGRWQQGILSAEGGPVRVGGLQLPLKEDLQMLWPTDAGAGALLNEAAGRGDVTLVHTLLLSQIDLQSCDERANSTLHRAVLGGHVHVCQRLLEAKADPMKMNADGLSSWDLALRGAQSSVRRVFSPSSEDLDAEGGATPLATVSDHMHEREHVRRLLEGAIQGDTGLIASALTDAAETKIRIVDTPNKLHVTPLMFAARAEGGQDAVRLLIKRNATVNLRTRRFCTALMMAAEAGQLGSVQLLLKANAAMDVNALDTRGYSALHLAVENDHREVAKVLIDNGADVNSARNNHWTCILSAAFLGSTTLLELLVKHSADVNALFRAGRADNAPFAGSFAPVHLAAYNGFDATLNELGRLGANVDQAMGNGWSPLMVAAAQGHTAAVASLIAMKANVDYQGPGDRVTALMAAAWHPQGTACMGLLLQARAKVYLQDSCGLNALMLSARLGHAQSVQQLLLQRADPKLARVGGSTALMDAAAAGSEEIVKMLISGGADVAATDDEGMSALMHATKGGHELAVQPLLRAGANVQRLDLLSRPAIAYATTKQVARRLLEAGAKTDYLADELCLELGLSIPASRTGSLEGSKAPSSRSPAAAKPAIRTTASSTTKRQEVATKSDRQADKPEGALQQLRAGEADARLLSDALSPLRLPPTIADTAPLLQIYPQNASATQTGAATIIQLNFRAMRVRRQKEAKARFFMPRSIAKKV